MNDLQPLMALLAQTETERDSAQVQHQRLQDALNAAQAQAGQLVDYRRDYEQRWRERFANVGQIELVHCYHGFVNRLTQAVEHQARVEQNAAGQLERAREVLLQHETRVASVRKLIERRVDELRRIGDRREQQQLDELASRAAWNRRASASANTRF